MMHYDKYAMEEWAVGIEVTTVKINRITIRS